MNCSCGSLMPVLRAEQLVSGYVSRTRLCATCDTKIITHEIPFSISRNGMNLRRAICLSIFLIEKYLEDEPLDKDHYEECRQARLELERLKTALDPK